MVLLRWLFSLLIVRPLTLIVLGIHIRHRERLPEKGPAILVANHNSHLDTLVMMTLFPLRMLNRIRPVAAADYFLKNRWLAWFSLNIMHIIPLRRKGGQKNRDLFQGITTALAQGDLVILYPEGSRGEPERLQKYKSGIYHLARECPDVPIYPIFMHGLGKALPKGDPILVPFFCDVFVGEPFRWQEDRQAFMEELNLRMAELAGEGDFAPWE
ncbi:lysophospholipid acyltransferase family protein [Kroppenstedtia eburnea]|uniref:1-acyl-sn-glycerol-3-phosphate acyltransferases n=1 Tax=Kroppenstedtia eburnea TaxID=714067 RepID=A0A1N7KS22_9BACL|nr:lysophospholipid acyltransferase family protein [Kroppenstedtia eburnea]EGK12430.1 1-acylglycerol-3-phosphate O-acyltransferase [Desmospora sp. 8437]QKI82838.1 1-acyl-sn-glycerol-3-phosphate acyltransferase [Kroppenstedtia eburnea]SIS64364.1 1-acyl-sn-glycerol-3-phosphate acyltransferases [Kroppenstedtia eburnea]